MWQSLSKGHFSPQLPFCVRQWIRKYSWTPVCDSQFENTPRHPCDSHFLKGNSALSWSFPLKNWNKTNVYEMITHYKSCQQCRTVSNSVNCYSVVLPPSPMVFFWLTYFNKWCLWSLIGPKISHFSFFFKGKFELHLCNLYYNEYFQTILIHQAVRMRARVVYLAWIMRETLQRQFLD